MKERQCRIMRIEDVIIGMRVNAADIARHMGVSKAHVYNITSNCYNIKRKGTRHLYTMRLLPFLRKQRAFLDRAIWELEKQL